MSREIDLWAIYGSRQDVDAAIVRHLDHELTERDHLVNEWKQRCDAQRDALEAVGLRFRPHRSGVGVYRVMLDDDWEGPQLTSEMVSTLRELDAGVIALVEVVRTDDQQADAAR